MMDATLLGQVLDQHATALTLYARQWCVTPEDVVQEAFVKLVGQAKTPTPVLPWLYRVVRNLALTAARAEQRRRRHESKRGEQQASWFFPHEDGPLDAALVADALRHLPAEEREIIVLHLWGGLSFAEIAEVLDCSSSSAHRRYVAGLQQLRERVTSCPKPSNPNFTT